MVQNPAQSNDRRRDDVTVAPRTHPGERHLDDSPQHAIKKGLEESWHRRYVGGLWQQIGRLQFEFLKNHGLRPDDLLLDVACGSLRAGVHFIPYLDADRYLGIDRNEELIQTGIEQELGPVLYREKRPRFVVSGEFEFEKFAEQPAFALAQSLFTHLPPQQIATCLRRLRVVIASTGRFYATFNESAEPKINPGEAHDHRMFWYTATQMERFGRVAGWQMEYLGGWGHPRGQQMLLFTPT